MSPKLILTAKFMRKIFFKIQMLAVKNIDAGFEISFDLSRFYHTDFNIFIDIGEKV